jgi:hypothetical protein
VEISDPPLSPPEDPAAILPTSLTLASTSSVMAIVLTVTIDTTNIAIAATPTIVLIYINEIS